MRPVRAVGPGDDADGTPERVWAAAGVPADLPVWEPPAHGRLVVVSAHPDDEVLGCGGLVARVAAAGTPVLVVAVTDGTASHPGSTAWTPAVLGARRPAELREALDRLGAGRAEVVRLRLPDGAVAAHEDAVAGALADLLHGATGGDDAGPGDLLVSVWRGDGHPDHETVGRAAARAAARRDVDLHEVPVWMWHWAHPADERVPWSRVRRLPLSDGEVERKRSAVAAMTTQVEAAPDDPAGQPVLPPAVLERLLRTSETVITRDPGVTRSTPVVHGKDQVVRRRTPAAAAAGEAGGHGR